MKVQERIESLISQMTLDEKIKVCTGKNRWQTWGIERLSIPSVTMSDGTNGVRFQRDSDVEQLPEFAKAIQDSFDSEEALEKTYPATCFPTGSAMACSWDRELLMRTGSAIAAECRALGIDLLLGPGMNIRRHPLTARNYEYYSEDPCLSGELAAAMVNGIQNNGVGACIKHFVCHNSDTFRTRVNVEVDERALQEIYLAGFKRAIEKSNPVSLMSAYNQVNGVEASGNSPLLKEVLKKEWAYEGAVISDWGAVKDVVESTKGGLDLQMPCSPMSAQRLKEAVESGQLEEAFVDERVRRILFMTERLKELKKPAAEVVDFNHHHLLAQEAAAESAVLLKNENHILPIAPDRIKHILVVGERAVQPLYQGTGCSIIHAMSEDIPLQQLQELCRGEIEVVYAKGCGLDGLTDDNLLAEAQAMARAADLVLVFAGTGCPGESDDYNRRDMKLDEGQEQLIECMASTGIPVAVIAASGESMEMPWRHRVQAVLNVWFGGEGMGKAVAELLMGVKTPCGRLSATIPERLEDTPAYLSFPGNCFDLKYTEGIYTGYRYYDKKKAEPAYPFGYGLSYTEFLYENMSVSRHTATSPDQLDGLRVTVQVKNTGSRGGKEVVQLYLSQGRPALPRPVRELKGFEKVWLEAGESKKVEFILQQKDFAYYDPAVKAFVVDADCFEIETGSSSRDIRLSEQVTVENSDRPEAALRRDCGFTELFADKKNEEKFMKFLEEHGLIKAGNADSSMRETMIGSFWPVSVYLDMNAGQELEWEDVEEFFKGLC